VNGMKLVTP